MARHTRLVFALLDLGGLALVVALLAVHARLAGSWREPALLALGCAAAGYVWLWRRPHRATLPAKPGQRATASGAREVDQ